MAVNYFLKKLHHRCLKGAKYASGRTSKSFFPQKRSIVGVWLGPKYNFDNYLKHIYYARKD